MTTAKIPVDRARYDDMLAALRLLSVAAHQLGQELDMARDPNVTGVGDGTASSVLEEARIEDWNSPSMQALRRLEEAGLCQVHG